MGHTILVTNDDGVEAPGLLAMVQGLHDEGYNIIVCAPDGQRSASSMHLTLHKKIKLRKRDDLLSSFQILENGATLEIFDVSGYPADCVLLALEGGLPDGLPLPSLCVSGINHGPNLSVDILHSGTVGGARQAGTCGLPSIATSIDSYTPENFEVAVKSTLLLINSVCKFLPEVPVNIGRTTGSKSKIHGVNSHENIRKSFVNGDIFLNLNVPIDWGGDYVSSHLGARWYRGALDIVEDNGSEWVIQLGAASIHDETIIYGDSFCIKSGNASVTTLGTWPQGHPLSISDEFLKSTISPTGLPKWINQD